MEVTLHDVEVVLLAQASMARLAPKVPADLGVPVLASPPLAVERLREVLARTGAAV